MRRLLALWLALIGCGHAADALAVRVYFDNDGDGAFDQREVGAPEVLVSDGDRLFRADADGRVSIEPLNRDEPPRRVFIILPGGHRATSPWHRLWPPETGQTQQVMTFGIQPSATRTAWDGAIATDPQVTVDDAQDLLAKLRTELAPSGARPGFVAVLGDLTEHGAPAELAAWRKATETWPVALYPLFGGRDGAASEGSRIALFETELGPAWYAFWSAGRCYLALVTEPEVLTGQEQARQLRWLGRMLAALPADTRCVILGHVPPAAREINRIGVRHRVEAVCYGHWHEASLWRYDELPMLGIGPYRGDEWGPGTGNFRRLEFGADGLRAPVIRSGFDQFLRILTPSERQPPERVTFPIRVAAYHTPAAVQEVTVSLDGGPAMPLKAMAPMTWRLDLPAASVGKLTVTAKSEDGHQWTATSTVPDNAVPPGVRLDGGPPQPPLQRVWLASTGVSRTMVGGPALVDGRLYLGLPDASLPPQTELVCLDAFSGRRLWSAWADGAILKAPVVAGGRVFAVTAHSVAQAWDAANGTPLWRRDLTPGYPGRHRWSHTGLAAWRDRLLVPVAGGPVLALRQADGAQIAELPVSGAVTASPTVNGDLALVPTAAGVAAVDLVTNQRRWFTPLPLVRHGDIAVGGRLACLLGDALLAFDLADGALRWQTPLPSTGLDPAAPTVVGGQVWLPGQRPLACRTIDGQPQGDPGGGAMVGSVAVAAELVWNASAAGALSAWRLSDGTEVWRTDVGLPLKSGPLIAGNTVFVVDFDGNVHAYVSPDG